MLHGIFILCLNEFLSEFLGRKFRFFSQFLKNSLFSNTKILKSQADLELGTENKQHLYTVESVKCK